MIVKELIAELEKQDKNLEVLYPFTNKHGTDLFMEITDVKITKNAAGEEAVYIE